MEPAEVHSKNPTFLHRLVNSLLLFCLVFQWKFSQIVDVILSVQ